MIFMYIQWDQNGSFTEENHVPTLLNSKGNENKPFTECKIPSTSVPNVVNRNERSNQEKSRNET